MKQCISHIDSSYTCSDQGKRVVTCVGHCRFVLRLWYSICTVLDRRKGGVNWPSHTADHCCSVDSDWFCLDNADMCSHHTLPHSHNTSLRSKKGSGQRAIAAQWTVIGFAWTLRTCAATTLLHRRSRLYTMYIFKIEEREWSAGLGWSLLGQSETCAALPYTLEPSKVADQINGGVNCESGHWTALVIYW